MHDVVDFNKEVMERSREIPVLVDFWAEWCGPCKVLGPVLERIAAESDGRWALAKVDTETHREVSAHYNVRSIPNVKLFIDGVVKAEFLGALPEPTVRQWLKKNLPGKYAREIEQAGRLVTEGNDEEARALLEGIVQHEPDNHRACVMLAQITLFSNPDNAIDLVRPIEEDSEVFDMAEAIRTVAARIGTSPAALPEGNARADYAAAIADLRTRNYAGALEKFIGVIKNDRYYDDDGARKACIAIFKLLGEEHEVTQRFRREFGRALY